MDREEIAVTAEVFSYIFEPPPHPDSVYIRLSQYKSGYGSTPSCVYEYNHFTTGKITQRAYGFSSIDNGAGYGVEHDN